nr:S41 family peptidase [Aestuariispira insulae]
MFGVGVASGFTVANADDQETYKSLELFSKAFEKVREDYVEDVSEKELIEAAIQGMLSSLDPHSSYFSAKEYEDLRTDTKGEFGGLGIEVTMENGWVKVVSPIDETPAYRAGIKAGDYITHLDGESVQGLSLDQAVERMRGLVGEDIKLTIAREGVDPFDVTITRDKIKIRSVRYRVEDGNVGYIRISRFNEQTQPGLDQAIKRLNEETENGLAGYVLDLRNNPGGLLDQAISVSDTFLEQGLIVSTRGRDRQNAQDFRASKGDSAKGLPVVILINGGSASASEIVAGALQDHRRAILVGTDTFGKGSVQTILPLNRTDAIKLTTQRYYTPNGRSIQAKGIQPDIVVEQARLEVLNNNFRSEADLRGALDSENAPAENTEEAEAETGETTPADYQLSRAVDLIKAISLYSGMTDTR